MNNTKITWTEKTWNPMSGCERISEGCKYCYAKKFAEQKRGTAAFPKGFDLTIRPHKLKEPYKLKTPTVIFMNSMSDLFYEKIDNEFRNKIIDVVEDNPQHIFQTLTKRPEKMLEFSKYRKIPNNMWLGVTIESQRVNYRLDILKNTKCSIRFISIEPLLSEIDLDYSGIDWVIVGGESGMHLYDSGIRKKRGLVDYINKKWMPNKVKSKWVEGIKNNVAKSGAAFFFKQWGGVYPKSGGNVLNGKIHENYPILIKMLMDQPN